MRNGQVRPGGDREYLRRRQRHGLLPHRGWLGGLLLGGAALGLPALAHAWIARRARPPRAPSWGRAHRFAGRLGEIAFQQLGEGPPILLLHSFGPGHDSAEWRAVAETLSAHWSVYVPDLPGWARSAPPRAYRPGVYVSALEDFLSGVVREPAVVVAAGLPAAYALEIAAARPHLVRALALVCPQGIEPVPRPARPWKGEALLRRLATLPLVGVTALDLLTSRPALAGHLREEFAAPERVDAGLVEHHYRASHRREARRALGAYFAGSLRPATASLPSPGQPTWIAWGRKAVHPQVENADLWLHKLPQAEIEVFESCGSHPHAETPAAFCHALERFLAGLDG
jgi:4,5:9,10-diseco-3-hydroxy-5,9,17-trioxoandrosta-1(10),2-diene-4-oate hydrolase